MPWSLRTSSSSMRQLQVTTMNKSVMKWVMTVIIVWISTQGLHECNAAATNRHADADADSPHSGSVPYGSGQTTEHVDGPFDSPSGSSGEAESPSTQVEYTDTSAVVSSGDVQEESAEASAQTATPGDTEERTGSQPAVGTSQPAGPSKGGGVVGMKYSSPTAPTGESRTQKADREGDGPAMKSDATTTGSPRPPELSPQASQEHSTTDIHSALSTSRKEMSGTDRPDITRADPSPGTSPADRNTTEEGAPPSSRETNHTSPTPANTSPEADDVVTKGHMVTKRGDDVSVPDEDRLGVSGTSDRSSVSSDNADGSTFSGAPSQHFTTAGDVFTTQVETSQTAQSGSEFKVTSDQLYVSKSRTRRQSPNTDGGGLQHTTADFTSTVPSSAEYTSPLTPTPTQPSTSKPSSELSSADVSTVTTPTADDTTEVGETTQMPTLGMPCNGDSDCAALNDSQCLKGVCSCPPGRHSNTLDDACILEPYNLTVDVVDDTCLNISWLGGGAEYNVTVTSSEADNVSRSDMTRSSQLEMCPFSPGSNTSVSVVLSLGGEPATTWVVLKPTAPRELEISAVNETCVTSRWEAGEGETDFYIATMWHYYDNITAEVNGTTSDTQWTVCHLNPGTKFVLEVVSSSHGYHSNPINTHRESTVPSRPTEGQGQREESSPQKCVRLEWTAGPGHQDKFIVNGTSENETHTSICGLEPGSRYTFSIVAVSEKRKSAPLLVETCTDPDTVQRPRVEKVNVTWVTLGWEKPVGHVDRYIIRGNHSDDPIYVKGRTSATVQGLRSGTPYAFDITTEFCNRTSAQVLLSVRTNYSALTSANVSAEGTVLLVSWSTDQEVSVQVTVTVKDGQETVYRETVRTSPQLVHTNRSGTCFTISLRIGNSSLTQTIAHATDPAAPQKVHNLQAQRLTNDSRAIQVTWLPPEVTNGVITFYNVSVQGLRGLQQTSRRIVNCEGDCDLDCSPEISAGSHGTASRTSGPPMAKELSQLFEELSEYENYKVTVTAFTDAGAGPSSSVPVEGQRLDEVTNLNIAARNATCLDLTWEDPANAADEDPQVPIHFEIHYQDVEQSDGVSVQNVTERRVTLCGLRYWTRYLVNVTAVGRLGPGKTAMGSCTTGEHVPGKVSNFSVSNEKSIYRPREVTVTWSAPVQPYGVINSYFVTVLDKTTSTQIESRFVSTRGPDKNYSQRFTLIGDHLYHIEVFGATSAGNGSKASQSVIVPAGILPHSRSTVTFGSEGGQGTPTSANIPAPMLCNFSFGRPVNAGFIIYRHNWAHSVGQIRNGYSVGASPVVTAPWSASSRSCFLVQIDVRSRCRDASHGGYISVPLEDKQCSGQAGSGGSGPGRTPPMCSGPLQPSTQYHFLVVFCTSVGCTYTQPAPVFTSQPEPESSGGDSAGLGAGLAVVFLLLGLLSVAGYWFYKKKRRPQNADITLQPVTTPEGKEIISKSRPVALESFVEHVQELHKDSNLGFADEYKTIKDISPSYPVRAAELLPCKVKNRYTNILPWDWSRVKLIPTDDEEGSDYINASYLPGENHQREFIAAQGPLPGTVDDFWRMVWENRVGVIVMLTQCTEKGKTKCEKYWPDERVQTIYGDLVVEVRSQSVLPDYIIKVIDVKLGSESRMIKHFHFMRWPDHGCPERTSMLLNFVSSVRAHMPHYGAGPTLVHCSAGVGRTGTFIAIDRLLLQIRQRSHVDIFNLVLTMREHRMLMVQSENQYVYIHDCLADALTTDKESDDEQSEDEEDEHVYGNC
ncbi:receptor-type tyrosine-protein phosphatase H-like isoform X2 [Babylonia areolata]|uniref:receptor-type tyrosine-protein phosphatase H-like isoform X2 n=1 Tax=Babylonia areolata TaxID=304850 RepID=UPI003FD3BB54